MAVQIQQTKYGLSTLQHANTHSNNT